jgi:hypothetical protein
MADNEKTAPAGKPQPYPKNWGKMNATEKAAWHKQYRPNRDAGKPVPPAALPTPKPPMPAPTGSPATLADYDPEYDQAAGLQPLVDAGQGVSAAAEQLVATMTETDLRAFVATIIRAVADALECVGKSGEIPGDVPT